jgi:ATP-binding cassette subfamily B protein
VLDEATSALDTEAELEIQQALAAVMKGRTVLAIAHRLSTVAKFDRLLFFAKGGS